MTQIPVKVIRSRRRWVSSSAGVGSGLSEEGFTCYWGGDPVSGDSWVLTQTFKNSSTHHWGYALLIWEQSCWEGWCDWSSTVSLQIHSIIITVLYFPLNSWVCEVSELFKPSEWLSSFLSGSATSVRSHEITRDSVFVFPIAFGSDKFKSRIGNTMEVLRELNISDDVFEGVFLNPIFMSIMQWNSLFLLEKSDLVLLIFFFKEQLKKKASKKPESCKVLSSSIEREKVFDWCYFLFSVILLCPCYRCPALPYEQRLPVDLYQRIS